jgi:hypothetical protein
MKYDKEKLKRLVHYVAWKAGKRDWFGAVKLNKVLWFADARQFVLTGKPITGAVYIREKFGPVPKHMLQIQAELEKEGLARIVPDKPLKRLVALKSPDTSLFTKSELTMVNHWIEQIDKQHTAGSISEESHDYAWEIARMGEEIPLYAVLANRIRDPNDEELARTKKRAKELGLI